MNELVSPTVENVNGNLMVSSLNIAKVFEKSHKNILRDIENEISQKHFSRLNFELSKFKDARGKERTEYLLDERFTMFLILGFTGNKAKQFKLAYIDEFIRMRNLLNNDNKIKELQSEITRLKQLLQQQSIDFTNQTIEKNKLILERKSRSNYYQYTEEIDIFGNTVSKYQYIPRDKELLYKIDCCENTIKGCLINGNKYINELKEMGIIVEKKIFLNC